MADSTTPATAATPPPGWEVNLVNPPYVGYQLVTVACVFASLSTLVITLRLFTRKFLVKTMGWDDAWVTISWFWGIVLTIADCIQTKYGAGTHQWDVLIPRFETFLKWQMLLGTSYIATLMFSKVSILVFYLRLTPERNFRIMVYITIAFVLSYNIAGAFVVIFSCSPTAASWDLALAADPNTKCVNRPAAYVANAAFNIFADLVIFCLPLRTIWAIQLPLKQRLSVIAIFATGLFVTVVSIIRIKSVVNIFGSDDVTFDTSDLLLWSTIEAHVTIICACLATLKPFMKRFFPTFLGGSSQKPSNYPSGRQANSKYARNSSYALKSFKDVSSKGSTKGFETIIETGNGGRKGYGDSDSEEFIFGVENREGVVVTKTVEMS